MATRSSTCRACGNHAADIFKHFCVEIEAERILAVEDAVARKRRERSGRVDSGDVLDARLEGE